MLVMRIFDGCDAASAFVFKFCTGVKHVAREVSLREKNHDPLTYLGGGGRGAELLSNFGITSTDVVPTNLLVRRTPIKVLREAVLDLGRGVVRQFRRSVLAAHQHGLRLGVLSLREGQFVRPL